MNPNVFALKLEWLAQKREPLTEDERALLRQIARELRGVVVLPAKPRKMPRVPSLRFFASEDVGPADDCEVREERYRP